MSDKSYTIKFINGKRCIVDGKDILEPWTKEECLHQLAFYQSKKIEMTDVFARMYDELAKYESFAKRQWMQENIDLFTKVYDENSQVVPVTQTKKKLNLFGE